MALKKNRLKMFENGALMKIFLSKREEIRGHQGKLHCEDPHRWCSSADVVRVIKVRERDRICDPVWEK